MFSEEGDESYQRAAMLSAHAVSVSSSICRPAPITPVSSFSAHSFLERAEALATLFLTRRNDVEIIPSGRYGRDASYDLLVRIATAHTATDTTFGVEVKGVRSIKRRGKNAFVVNYTRSELRDTGLPSCIFLFAVDDEQGYYRWLFEPVISLHDTAELHFGMTITHDDLAQRERIVARDEFAPLTDRAIDTIVEQVKHWYALKG